MSSSMRALAVVPAARQVRIEERPVPALDSPTAVKLRILEVGVCGTDKEICAFEYGVPPEASESLVIGHESLAEVVEPGPEARRVRPGDLVVPMVRRPCPHEHCLGCRSGRQDFCSTGDFRERGIKGAHGFMTEYVVEDERYLIPVPRALREVAVLVEPLTIAEKALLQLGKLQERLPWSCPHAHREGLGHCHRAVVLGAGPVGLLGAMALVANGFQTFVYSRDREDSAKAALTRSFGATYVSSATHDVAALGRVAGPIDLVYEAVGLSRLAFDVLGELAPNGVLILTGVPALKGPAPLDADRLMRRMVLGNQAVIGSVNAGRDAFEGAVRDLGRFQQLWPDALAQLITGRYPLDDYAGLMSGAVGGIKNLITLNGRG